MSDTIKLGERTLAILKNYASISPSIKLTQGQTLIVGDSTGTVLACATIDETIPADFPIANLSGLLTILGMKSFTDSTLDFSTPGIIDIKGKSNTVTFHASDEMFADLPGEAIPIDDVDFESQIDPETLKEFRKACGALGLTMCKLVNKDKKAYLVGENPLLPNSNDYTVELGDTELADGECSVKVSNLAHVLDGNYTLVANNETMIKFISNDERLQYMVGVEIE